MNTPITTGLDKVIDELYEDGIRTGIGINPLDGINCKRRAKQALLALITEERKDERNMIALDNYRGHTFSESTNWQYRFDKFIRNNEKRIKALDALGGGDE